jgi:hypothetical protein
MDTPPDTLHSHMRKPGFSTFKLQHWPVQSVGKSLISLGVIMFPGRVFMFNICVSVNVYRGFIVVVFLVICRFYFILPLTSRL